MAKFLSFDAAGNEVEHDYGNVFFRQPSGGGERLVIGPSGSQVKLLDELAATFPAERYFILYVLLMSHGSRAPGRYQSPVLHSHEELQLFIWTFQEFFEGDGRHHVWIGDPESNNLLIYDQHNVIFAYGDLDAYQKVLATRGFEHSDFWFPSPHVHQFHPANADAEDELMSYFAWRHFPLQPGDEWS